MTVSLLLIFLNRAGVVLILTIQNFLVCRLVYSGLVKLNA